MPARFIEKLRTYWKEIIPMVLTVVMIILSYNVYHLNKSVMQSTVEIHRGEQVLILNNTRDFLTECIMSLPRFDGQGWTKTRILLFIFLPTLLVLSMFRGLYQGEVVILDGLPVKTILTENASLNAQVITQLGRLLPD